jgi:hypothetical protein
VSERDVPASYTLGKTCGPRGERQGANVVGSNLMSRDVMSNKKWLGSQHTFLNSVLFLFERTAPDWPGGHQKWHGGGGSG